MSKEDTDKLCGRVDDSSNVANPKLVPKLLCMLVDVQRVLPQQRTALQMSGMKQEVSPLIKKMVLIACRWSCSPVKHWEFLKRQPLLSYSPGERELQSSSYLTSKEGLHIVIKKKKKQIDPVFATVPLALDFLMELVGSGIGYSGINTARSALSSVLKRVDGMTFGGQERFLKGVYEVRPSKSRYAET